MLDGRHLLLEPAMTKFSLVSIALAAIASPVLAAPVAGVPFSFDADGKHFDAVRVDTPNGTILTGSDSERNSFRLQVAGRSVTGFYGDGPVSYTISAPLAPQQQLALK
jgi:hypothetical protein